MKALQFDRTGDLAALELVDMPDPLPAADEVRVEIRAAGLNPSDVKNVLGRFPYTTLPRVPGRDFAGVVVEGPKALLGQAVWGTGREPGFFRDGSHAQFLTLPAAGVALKPESLSFAQAASCGVPYSTAWDALQRSQVKAGTRLLVIGASGAVGKAALALAKALGAEAIGAVRREEQRQALEAQGIAALLLGEPAELAAQVEGIFPGGAEGDLRYDRFLARGGGPGAGRLRSPGDHRRTGRRPCAPAGVEPVPSRWLGGGDQLAALWRGNLRRLPRRLRQTVRPRPPAAAGRAAGSPAGAGR